MRRPRRSCAECAGRGYALFSVNRAPGEEVQRNDGCGCLAWRCNVNDLPGPTDDDARLAFVHDLERGDRVAAAIARTLLALLPTTPSKRRTDRCKP